MTPAAQTIYINRETGAVTGSLTGTTPPALNYILRAGARLDVVFHTDGTAEELEASTTGRLVMKPLDDAGGAAFFLDTAWTKDSTTYTFSGEMDSADLRAALEDVRSVQLGAQVLWKEPSETYDGSSLVFNVTIHTNLHRSDDAAPIVSNDVNLVLNDDETAFEAFVNGVSKGFIHLSTTAP